VPVEEEDEEEEGEEEKFNLKRGAIYWFSL